MNPVAHLNQKLSRRGILTAARNMQWTPDSNGWRYPVFDASGSIVTYRWKNADRTVGQKYLWKPNKPSGCRYYHALDVVAAIRATGGVVYIANGEPSVLAYHAAGIRNVLCWFGETSVPATLAADLQQMGIVRVIYVPDRDEAGHTSAAKVRDLLAGSGIDFEALDWGDGVPEKGDANDLWIQVGFDSGMFRQRLAGLAHLSLPEPVTIIAPQPRRESTGREGRVDRERLLSDVLDYFQKLPGWKKSGGFLAGRSPFRKDKKPSTTVSLKSGFYLDYATGDRFSLFELAEQVGFQMEDYRTKLAVQQTTTSHQPLPDSVIFEIARSFTPGAAMLARLIDELWREKKLPQVFTPGQLLDLLGQAGYCLNRATFYRSLALLESVVVAKNHTSESEKCDKMRHLLPFELILMAVKKAMTARLMKKYFPAAADAAHLPEFSVQMLEEALDSTVPHEMVEILNQSLPVPEPCQVRTATQLAEYQKRYREAVRLLEDRTVTQMPDLPEEARSKPGAFLDTLRRAKLAEYDRQQVSGRQAAALTGIEDRRAVSRKLRALGIQRHEVKLIVEIQAVAEIQAAARQHRAYPLRLVAVNRTGTETSALSVDNRHAERFINLQRQAGYTVYVELQAASRIELGEKPEKEERSVPTLPREQEENEPAVAGKYTEDWLLFHLRRRLRRMEQGFLNATTGEVIPGDLAGSVAELVEALTGFRVREQGHQVA